MSTGPTTSRSDHRLQDEQRFAVLRRLLHGNDIGLRERFAGSVLLLYAQPLTRIAKRRTSDSMTADGGETAITVARGAIVLPEPLASIALVHQRQQAHAKARACVRLARLSDSAAERRQVRR